MYSNARVGGLEEGEKITPNHRLDLLLSVKESSLVWASTRT